MVLIYISRMAKEFIGHWRFFLRELSIQIINSFIDQKIWDCFSDLCMLQRLSFVWHPAGNDISPYSTGFLFIWVTVFSV